MSQFHDELPEASLRATLNLCNAEDLKLLIPLLPGVNLKAPRKGEIIDVLEKCLLGPTAESLWKLLDPLQQMAVRETVHNGAGRFDADRFQAKHGTLPRFRKDSGKTWQKGTPTPLRLFIHSTHRWSDTPAHVPGDLREHLMQFVPEPPQAQLTVLDELPKLPIRKRQSRRWDTSDGTPTFIETTQEVPLTQRLTEQSAIQDLRIVLRLTEQEKLGISDKTLRPSKMALKNLEELLCEGDFYEITEPENKWDPLLGAIKCFSWPLLVQAAKLAKIVKGKLTLTKQGLAALDGAPEKALQKIWDRWLENKLFDEFNRIDTIKGQTGKGKRAFTPPSDRRFSIVASLRNCPADKWIEFDEFSRYMRATGMRFQVHTNPWKLYIGDPQYGSLGYEGYGGWNILQERYLLCLLFEYAAPLGIIDLAYEHPQGARTDFHDLWGTDDLHFLSRYDGLKYFRLTPLGAYILGESDSWQPAAIKPEGCLTVLPNRGIRLTDGKLAPDEIMQLENFADPVEPGQWILNEAKIITALEKGASMTQFRSFLETRDPQPLPEMVDGFLRAIERKASACVCKGTALLIECDSTQTAETIATNPHTRRLCRRTGEKGLVVSIDKEKAFRAALNSIGYGMPLV